MSDPSKEPEPLPPVTWENLYGEPLRRRPRWWLPTASTLLLLLSLPVLFLFLRSSCRQLSRARSDRYAGKAASFIDAGAVEEALPQAHAAIEVAPWNPPGQLQMARALSMISHPHAFPHWQDYFAMDTNLPVLPSLEFARFNLQLGRPLAARQHLLGVKDTNNLAVLLALATLETNAVAAGDLLLAARRLARTSDERMAVATTAFNAAWPEAQLAGRNDIMEMARSGDAHAQVFLLTQPGTNAHFAAASFELGGTNRWRPEWQPVADLVAGRSRSAAPLLAELERDPGNLHLAAALANLGTNVATPTLLASSRTNVALFFLQADQMRHQHRWEELESVAGDAKRGLPEDLKSALGALAAHGRGDTNNAYKRMTLALEASKGMPARLLGLARFAQQDGYAEFEAAAWLFIGSEPELGDVGGRRLFELGVRNSRIDWIASGAEILAHGDATSSWFGTWVYARCMAQHAAGDIPEPKGEERDSVVAAILRFALRGDVDEAFERIAATRDWSDQPVRLRLVKALAYDRAGQRSDVRRELAAITNLVGLLPEELALYRKLNPPPSE